MNKHIELQNRRTARVLSVACLLIPPTLLVIAIWLPFGGSLIGNIEEWGLLGVFSTNGPFYLTTPDSPLAAHALRPLTIFPQALSYNLDPYSFKYWNILLAVAIVAKGIGMSYITRWITRNWYWGVAAGLILIVYPADTMQLSFRSLHINWALAGALLGAAGLLKALTITRIPLAYLLAAVSSTTFGLACAMYEASLLLAPAPLLFIFARYEISTIFADLKRGFWIHLVWFCGPLAYVFYVIRTAPLVHSYQSTLSGQHAIESLTTALPHLFDIGLLRTLLGGWYDAVGMTRIELTSYGYVIGVVISLVTISALLLRKLEAAPHQTRTTQALKLLTIGVCLAMLGYAPYLLSLPHQSISQRTFLFASPGGVLAWIAVLIIAHSVSRLLTVGVAVIALAVGFSSQLFQFHHYVNLAKREQQILNSIALNFEGHTNGKTLLILDKSNQLNDTWMFIKENLSATMNYMYGKSVGPLEICHIPSQEWQQADSVARKGICEEREAEWIFHYPTSVSGPGVASTAAVPDRHIAKTDLIIITVDPDGADQKNPARLSTDNLHLQKIYNGVIAPLGSGVPLVSFRDQRRSSAFRWNFGDWWSLDLPTAGSGWREAEWKVGLFKHDAGAWKTAPVGYLLFNIEPRKGAYSLVARFSYVVPKIKDSVTININGAAVTTHWTSESELSATFDGTLLKDGSNSVEVISDVDATYYGLSVNMTSLEITPLNK